MRRKDGLRKLKALRAMPLYKYGFKDHPSVSRPRGETWTGRQGFSCVSMFAGCGGLDLGIRGGFRVFGEEFPSLPFHTLAAYDFDEKSMETYQLNLGQGGICADLCAVQPDTIPAAQVLLGGFPCQDFSSCGTKQGLEGKRGRLYEVMSAYMRLHQPLVVIGENVPFLERLHDGTILKTVLADFESCGYKFNVWRIRCQDYGLPQSRTRVFLIGVRSDLPGRPQEPPLPLFARPRTIDQAIDDLVGVTDETVTNQSQYFVATKATKGAGQGDQKCKAGEVSFTIRANSKARIQFHYGLDRRLTVRECARLQSFPDEFVFPHAAGTNMMQIGNAVPPMIGYLVGDSVARFLRTVSQWKAA